jgi:hypothetical protein
VMDREELGLPGCFLIGHAALFVGVLAYWQLLRSVPCNGPGCGAYADVSMVASLVAFGCVLLAAAKNWPRQLLVTAVGASVLAVVTSIVAVMGTVAEVWDLPLPVFTVMLTVVPIWLLLTMLTVVPIGLLLTRWPNQR